MSAYVKAPRGRSPLDSIKPYQRPASAARIVRRLHAAVRRLELLPMQDLAGEYASR
jgi:ApbE superfamily uncharacterized protein (UPF0280 family)